MTYQEKSFEKIQKALDKLSVSEAIETYQNIGEWLSKKIQANKQEAEQQLQQLNVKSE